MKILKSVNTRELTTENQKARYALLYSIALDKNFIDVTSDSIIAPAVKYYERHGDRNTRFTCHYYEARIYENAGDLDKALLCISKAESIDTLNIDANILSLLFAMKGTIYDKVWRTQEAVDAWETARKYALTSGKYRHYAYYSLSCAISNMKSGNIESSRHCIPDAEKYKKYFTPNIIGKTNRDEIQNQMRLKFARKLQKRNVTEKSRTSYSQKWLSNVN